MPPSPEERREIVAACTRFVTHHYPKSVKEQLLEAANSPYAKLPKDHYGNGGFANELEAHVAQLLGKEAAVFMPSGTMAQQIALRIWCDRAQSLTVAFHPTCHLQIHEQMAYREMHGMKGELVGPADRLFTLEDLETLETKPSTLLVELPQREIGGQLPSSAQLQEIASWGNSAGVRLHLDGARLWECQPFYGRPYAEIAGLFDSVYVSFYKILGGLPGAILAGPGDFIAEAKIWQRRHGGNLYQSAPNAISAMMGLDRHLPKIEAYCAKAAEIARAVSGIEGLRLNPARPPTNMMHIYLSGDKERLEAGAWRLARDEKIFLFGGLMETDDPRESKLEFTAGEATLDWSGQEVGALFTRLLARS